MITAGASLADLVKAYRRATAELRRAKDADRYPSDTYLKARNDRIDAVRMELFGRREVALVNALDGERHAHDDGDPGMLRAQRRWIRERLAFEAARLERVAKEAEVNRVARERHDELLKRFTDKRSRKWDTRLVEKRAWNRVVQYMPALEYTGLEKDTDEWCKAFVVHYDRLLTEARTQFSGQLDELVREYRIAEATKRGFTQGARVRLNHGGAVLVGEIVRLVVGYDRVVADVDWGHGDPHLTCALDELKPYVEPEPLRMILARISYLTAKGQPVHNMEDGQYEDIEGILDDVRHALENGATHVWVDDVHSEST